MAPLNIHHSQFSISYTPPPTHSNRVHHIQTSILFKIPKQPQNFKKNLSISSCTSPAQPTSPIFLPFLQTPSRKEAQEPEPSIDDQKINDPILKFFKTRPLDPDPSQEGRITLQKNRRTSWHLAPTFGSNPESDDYVVPLDEKQEKLANVVGVVGEVVEIARGLPENVTIGEALERCELGGRLGEEECVEVLRLLGEEGDVMGCLYFFEWMGLREPCLVSPRALSVLFPVLGRAAKGDELLVVFRNLLFEQNRVFTDVRVYNAAISGLLFCGRY